MKKKVSIKNSIIVISLAILFILSLITPSLAEDIKIDNVDEIERFQIQIHKAINKNKDLHLEDKDKENVIIKKEDKEKENNKPSNLNLKYIKENVDVEIVKFSEFKKLVEEGKVKSVILDKNFDMLEFKQIDGKVKYTNNPQTDTFKEFLVENDVLVQNFTNSYNIAVNSKRKGGINWFGIASIGVMFYVIYSATRGRQSEEASIDLKNRTNKANGENEEEEEKEKITFDNLKGADELKKDMRFVVDFLNNPKRYEEMGAKMPKGIVLFGPPGTGKTLTAKAIAGEAGVPFYSVSGSDFVEKYVGVGAKRVRDLYKKAKETSPCIVFIDEIDAVGGKRSDDNNSERDQTLNALLAELDGFDSKNEIITIVATNRLELLDDALIRPGRFDKHLAVELPDQRARYDILKFHARDKKLSKEIDLEEISKLTVGFSGAALEALLNEAAFLAVVNNKEEIDMKSIEHALFKQQTKGDIKDGQDFRDKKELEIVAWHEAGHALLTKLLTDDEVSKVTILASTSGAGGVTFTNPKERSLYTKEYIESKIIMMYGGRAAEEILLGHKDNITTGASNDIEQASSLIKQYITDFGMSEDHGMLNINVFTHNNDNIIDTAIEISNKLYGKTVEILNDNKDILKAIATKLLKEETLTDEDLNNIIKGLRS